MDVILKSAEKRITMSPVYAPDTIDKHGEWASSDEIEKAVVEFHRTGDRTLRLQHTERAAGEVIALFTWPYPVEADVFDHRRILKGKQTFPAGTAFATVRWTEEAWGLLRAGRLTGLSMGGSARRIRIEADTEPAVAKRAPQSLRRGGSLIERVMREGSVRL
ncbi:MAG TPA: XkdF-like putative serine protease domain-containing protein [Gaiellaceae bacterium]|nr:XkdF-like putative serine protease domain-containing protein [Gaiellaceae bacterium]